MWNRKELKANAKGLLKKKYWTAVGAAAVLGICSGIGSAASSASDASESESAELLAAVQSMDLSSILAVLAVLLVAIAVACVVSILLTIFLYGPLEVGAQNVLIRFREGDPDLRDVAVPFKVCYKNTVKTMFLRTLYIWLWSLLLIVPGIVKAYEYRMVPFLLAEDPAMSRQEAFAKSKEMMKGNKWHAFVMDWSFILWDILGICTLGIVELFYVAPYRALTNAELYHTLKD